MTKLTESKGRLGMVLVRVAVRASVLAAASTPFPSHHVVLVTGANRGLGLPPPPLAVGQPPVVRKHEGLCLYD